MKANRRVATYVGKALLTRFLSEVQQCFPEIRRIELEARASNEASLGLYRSLGFVQEGVYRNKTRNRDGRFVDSIPMAWSKVSGSGKWCKNN